MFEPFAVLVSALTSQWASATTEVTLNFKRWPSLSPFACEWGPEVTEAMTFAPRPNFVRNSSQVIVPELNPPRSFPTAVAKNVYHLLSLRSRVNLQ